MVEILEQPDIRRLVAPMSVETYHLLAESGPDVQPIELIRGVVIEKTDKMSRSQLHVFLVRFLFHLFQVAARSLDMLVLKEDPITLADSEPEPDVAVVPNKEEYYRFARVTTALLIVEVAVTSLELDRIKAALYAEAGVPEYWIVRAIDKSIDVYTMPVGSIYAQCRTYELGESLTTPTLPTLRVDLSVLFAEQTTINPPN